MTQIINATTATPHPFNYGLHKERELNGKGNLCIAFLSDTHIGYSAHKHVNRQGLNLRELDGETALAQCVRGIIADPTITTVIHGGDFFHSAKPTARQIKVVKSALDTLGKAGIKVFGQAGNHDVSDVKSELTAVSLLDDQSRHSYALWTPYQVYQIADGVFLHSVSHHGLRGSDAPIVKAVEDGLNIFSTHGAALDPANHTLMQCADSVREQFIPPEMVIDDSFIAKMLGHYHNRYAIGDGNFNAWYAGSTVRRGFSDDAGGRGWMRFELTPNGELSVESRNIFQRPQFDLPVIDAEGLTATEFQELVAINIANTGADLELFDEVNAPIVRQRATNATRSLRKALDRRHLNDLSKNMLHWDLDLKSPAPIKRIVTDEGEVVEQSNEEQDEHTPSLASENNSGGAVDYFDKWVNGSSTLLNIPESHRPEVTTNARSHLANAENLKGN